MREQWRAACAALTGGRAGEALRLFEEFDAWYGEEAMVAEARFRESRIRLWGLAALEAGFPDQAARLLARWLEENPDEERFRAFIRFQLAGLYTVLGQPEEANAHQEAFLEEYPDLPECALIQWSRADEALRAKAHREAREYLEAARTHSGLPDSGRTLASAALAMLDCLDGRWEEALARFQEPVAGKGQEVFEFWRAFMAPSLVQQLLQGGAPEAAVEASRWLDRLPHLTSRLRAFRASTEPARATGIRQAIWNHQWRVQLDRLEAALHGGPEVEAERDSLYALRLRALVSAKQSDEAAILGTALLRSRDLIGRSLRSEAYKGTIEACQHLRRWERAEALASEFLATYPDDPALPDMLFMNARTAAARQDWPAALDQVARLIEAYPDHPAHQSWKILQAGWMLESGAPEEALAILLGLEETAPAPWQPYLRFQAGRCHEALKEHEQARQVWEDLLEMAHTTAGLKESTLTALLKLHLGRREQAAFEGALEAYRREYPAGLNRLIVENLAGSYLQRTGRLAEAVQVYAAVASTGDPAADFAREQLSALYRHTKDSEGLRAHALNWIAAALRGEAGPSETPFLDCRHYQEVTRQAALPEATLQTLLEAIGEGHRGLASQSVFEVLRHQWAAYQGTVRTAAADIRDWSESRALELMREGSWPGYASHQLYNAWLLERAGRQDSADARRIQVLQRVSIDLLGEEAAFLIARTACLYHFPEAQGHLVKFLQRFPLSSRRPDALFHLAGLYRQTDQAAQASALVREIVLKWPDTSVYPQACLHLAGWHMEDQAPQAALTVLEKLLATSGLPAPLTARALLLRARADFQMGETERGLLACFRILTLYPDLNDSSIPAFALLLDQEKQIEEEAERADFQRRLRALAPAHVLSHFHIEEA